MNPKRLHISIISLRLPEYHIPEAPSGGRSLFVCCEVVSFLPIYKMVSLIGFGGPRALVYSPSCLPAGSLF